DRVQPDRRRPGRPQGPAEAQGCDQEGPDHLALDRLPAGQPEHLLRGHRPAPAAELPDRALHHADRPEGAPGRAPGVLRPPGQPERDPEALAEPLAGQEVAAGPGGAATAQYTGAAMPGSSVVMPAEGVRRRVRHYELALMSVYWVAIGYLWTSLGTLILPDLVTHLVGRAHK